MAFQPCRHCGTDVSPGSAFCPTCGLAQVNNEATPTTQITGTGRQPRGRLLHQRYRLLHSVGRGGMAAVYAAQDTQLGDRLVAVKEMSLSRLSAAEVPQAVEQFRQEAHLLANLHHPSLPVIHEYFAENERWYLVMSFIEGQTLQAALEGAPGKRLAVSQVVGIGIALCDVLVYLHQHKPQVIFRDLKPPNVMLTPKGGVCLIDFGIARHFKQEQAKDTVFYYSVGYAPPEQYGQSQTGPRSDIYSLGATLHHLLSGHNPSEQPFQFADLRLADQSIPDPLAELVTQMVEMREQERPTSVSEVKVRLEQVLKLESRKPQKEVVREEETTLELRVLQKEGEGEEKTTLAVSPDAPTVPQVRERVAVSTRRLRLSKGETAILVLLVLLLLATGGIYTIYEIYVAVSTSHEAMVKATQTTTAQATTDDYSSYVATHGIMFGFDPAHTRTNPYERTLNVANVSRLHQKWTAPTGDYIVSSPTVANGLVYVGSGDGKLYAFEALTGVRKWVSAPTGGGIDSSPAVVNGLVYVGSQDNQLYAFDALTGKLQWTALTGDQIFSSPTVADGVVYIGSEDDKLYAFDAKTGEQKWVATTGDQIWSSPTVANGLVYIGSYDHELYAFNAKTGALQWVSAPTDGRIFATPAVANGLVYVPSDDFKVYALNALTGEQKWVSVLTGNYLGSGTAVANGLVYVGCDDHHLYAFDALTGEQKWVSVSTGNVIASSPTVANGVVYVGSNDQKLYAFDALTGEQKWVSPRTGKSVASSPAVANSVVYVGSENHQLYAFSL
jgi:eukaryotic-like serine/threonine-protein kinase